MLSIKFKTKQYELLEMPAVEALRFQCFVNRGLSTIDEVVEEATGAKTIYIYDNEEVVGIYEGYERPIAFTLVDGRLSVELANTDIYKTIDALSTRISANETAIGTINGEVSNLNETQLSQDAAIEDLASAL